MSNIASVLEEAGIAYSLRPPGFTFDLLVGSVFPISLVSLLCVFFFLLTFCVSWPTLSVSLDCQFLITPSVFSSAYL